MTTKAKVSVLKTKPDSVLEDTGRAMEMADFRQHLDASATTILKDNISWHFPYPGANTTPSQAIASRRSTRRPRHTHHGQPGTRAYDFSEHRCPTDS